jgi:hypothetical protein
MSVEQSRGYQVWTLDVYRNGALLCSHHCVRVSRLQVSVATALYRAGGMPRTLRFSCSTHGARRINA